MTLTTADGSDIVFDYTFKAGKYGIKAWYDDYGWASVSGEVDVSAPAAYTASTTQSSYLGGQITITGDHISDSAVIKIGSAEGKMISSTASDAVFAIPALIAPDVVSNYA